ncbi:excalibur calcium-binding domain-containing protein [Aliiroseovarius sp. Z3]|uniref:excalibur calcium-binding domain-containing protein n=1 Tax=Aliiroseovarius sp. Z3 TaxID=2811402 RepID=UPI0023B26FD7|nr:excalibur calcium-binding domain-containing protein [Aliiroseovarius sp. Z3]MDE9448942.1 excalibur calcium-binding domain-containing protein [Aliiroseovarius sp. Z3]
MRLKGVIAGLFLAVSGHAAWANRVVYGKGVTLADQVFQTLRVSETYDCRNVSCKRLRSCAEACYKLTVCGQTKRDGDGDGIPCENLCSRKCPRP